MGFNNDFTSGFLTVTLFGGFNNDQKKMGFTVTA